MAGPTRQHKLSKLIQKELGTIFQEDKKGLFNGLFVTIADVRINPDLSIAKVYLSMMLTQNKQDAFSRINSLKSEIRKILGNRIRNQVRIIPDLHFYIDELEENAQRLDEIIRNLNIPPEKGSEG